MNKNNLLLIGLFLITVLSFSSCSESTGEVDPYANWDQRNQNFTDSIAKVALANDGDEVGDWKTFYSYKLGPLTLGQKGDVNDYVYCKIKSVGNGVTPLFSDTAYVSYKGMLINNVVFDKTYSGEYNPEIAVPTALKTGGLVTGFTTALENMKEGDIWTLYIPSDLGYGSTKYSTIPANSTLVFDVALVKVAKLKGTEQK
jgi:FKBP-type peptidyl-prolyl cis-trans isomerase FklB